MLAHDDSGEFVCTLSLCYDLRSKDTCLDQAAVQCKKFFFVNVNNGLIAISQSAKEI